MISLTTKKFWECYSQLPVQIQKRAKKAYQRFEENPHHPGLRFKKIIAEPDVYSVRITRDYRALGVMEENTIIWFWIGSHHDYESMLKEI